MPQVKRKLICCIINLLYELSHNLPKELRFRILGNYRILEKPQIKWSHNLVPSLSFKNSTLPLAVKVDVAKVDIKLSCPFNFIGLFYFVPNILPEIAVATEKESCVLYFVL